MTWVWIVTPFESLGPKNLLDECVMFAVSSQAAALRMIRTSVADPGTWWGVRPHGLDAPDGEQGPPILVSRPGRRISQGLTLARAPRERRAAKKKKGGTKSPPSRPS